MKRLIIANWKMNPVTYDDARSIFFGIEHRAHFYSDKVDLAVCPPYLFIPLLIHASHFVKIGAQNAAEIDKGALTGEVSCKQLATRDVQYVILGHSERRIFCKETDDQVKNKINQCINEKLVPVVCLGGDLKATRETMKRLVTKQFNAAVAGLSSKQIGRIVFVYEPTWAISTFKNSKPATGEHAADLIDHIRDLIKKKTTQFYAQNAQVLYGGSVNKANVYEFSKWPTISGALVGAASLDPDSFIAIVKEFYRESIHKNEPKIP
jgi:triosephosphate isomerase